MNASVAEPWRLLRAARMNSTGAVSVDLLVLLAGITALDRQYSRRSNREGYLPTKKRSKQSSKTEVTWRSEDTTRARLASLNRRLKFLAARVWKLEGK